MTRTINWPLRLKIYLALSAKLERVLAEPGSAAGASGGLGELPALAETCREKITQVEPLQIKPRIRHVAAVNGIRVGRKCYHHSLVWVVHGILFIIPSSLVGPGGPRDPVDPGQLAVLPAPDPEQVAHHIALFLAIELGHVLVRSHLDWDRKPEVRDEV